MNLPRPCVLCSLVVVGSISSLNAGAHEPTSVTPVGTPAQLAVVEYAYHVFPQQLADAERQVALAEHEAAFWQRRVKSFEPTRGFGVYGATYFADQSAQLEALAAQQRAACARQQVANLWRERQAVVATLMQQAAVGK